MLERRSAELAAQHATPAELDRMRAALDRMDDAALPMEEFNELDTEFHVCLADAGDNQLVADMTRAIRGAVRDALLEAFRARDDWPGTAARLRRQHRAIYDAVTAGDPDGGGGRRRTPHPRLLGRLKASAPTTERTRRRVASTRTDAAFGQFPARPAHDRQRLPGDRHSSSVGTTSTVTRAAVGGDHRAPGTARRCAPASTVDAEPLQTRAAPRAHAGVVLPDAGGEDDRVEPAEHGG